MTTWERVWWIGWMVFAVAWGFERSRRQAAEDVFRRACRGWANTITAMRETGKYVGKLKNQIHELGGVPIVDEQFEAALEELGQELREVCR